MNLELNFDTEQLTKNYHKLSQTNPFKDVDYIWKDAYFKGVASLADSLNLTDKVEFINDLTKWINQTSESKLEESPDSIQSFYTNRMGENLSKVYKAIDQSKEGQESPLWSREELAHWVKAGAKAAVETLTEMDSMTRYNPPYGYKGYTVQNSSDKCPDNWVWYQGTFNPMSYFDEVNN